MIPSRKNVDGLKSPANDEIYLYKERRTTKEPIVMKPVTARKIILRKNNCGVMKEGKDNKSSQMNIFSLMIESSPPQSIMITHDLKTFSVY